MSPKPKRVNKTKAELLAELERGQKIEREKQLVKLMFPFIADLPSIYDAQTVLAALSGYIKFELDKKTAEVLVKDLVVDLSKEEESPIKSAIVNIRGLLELEKAGDVAKLLERFGNILGQHSAHVFMKQPMAKITIEDIISS